MNSLLLMTTPMTTTMMLIITKSYISKFIFHYITSAWMCVFFFGLFLMQKKGFYLKGNASSLFFLFQLSLKMFFFFSSTFITHKYISPCFSFLFFSLFLYVYVYRIYMIKFSFTVYFFLSFHFEYWILGVFITLARRRN